MICDYEVRCICFHNTLDVDLLVSQGRIFLRRSSQCETSVMRVRLEGRKDTHYEYTLANYEYAIDGSDVYSRFH